MISISIKPSMQDFYLMVSGQIITILGSTLLRFALSLYVLDLTGRADIFAGLYAITSIPFLLAPLGGAIADRFNRRNLMVIFDFINTAIVLSFIVLLFTGSVSILLIGTIMFLLAIVNAMYAPVVMASIPQLVPEKKLEQANGIVNGVQALSNIVAPVLGGILYGIIGLKMLVIISCLAFFICDFRNVYYNTFYKESARKPYHTDNCKGYERGIYICFKTTIYFEIYAFSRITKFNTDAAICCWCSNYYTSNNGK